ncbi:MAG: helix-turn-helix domain-containing protein [Nitrospirae bacterium]|nr:helix-turn-helix domain-containing protein [Nitrospirota bacterium]
METSLTFVLWSLVIALVGWLIRFIKSLLGIEPRSGSPYVWQWRGILRAAKGNFARRGHFGVDGSIYKLGTLSESAKKVYTYLSRIADAQGYTFPFLGTIAVRTNLSKSTVGKALKELQEEGLLEMHHRYSRRGGSSNLYGVHKVSTVHPELIDEKN